MEGKTSIEEVKRWRTMRPLIIESAPFVVDWLISEHDRLTAANAKMREALEKLVALKKYKDEVGKDNYYVLEQCEAWEAARQAIKGAE